MPKFRDTLLGGAVGGLAKALGGGLYGAGETYRKSVGEETAERRRVRPRIEVAKAVGIMPVTAEYEKRKEELEEYSKREKGEFVSQKFLQEKMPRLYARSQEKISVSMEPRAGKYEYDGNPAIVKQVDGQWQWSGTNKEGEPVSGKFSEPEDILDEGLRASIYPGLTEAGKAPPDLMRLFYNKMSNEALREVNPGVMSKEELNPEETKAYNQAYNRKLRRVGEQFRVAQRKKQEEFGEYLHKQLPYYKDLLAMLQYGMRVEEATEDLTAEAKPGKPYSPKNIMTGMRFYDKIITGKQFQEIKGIDVSIISDVIKKDIENTVRNINQGYQYFSVEGLAMTGKAEKIGISSEEAVPFLDTLGRLPNIAGPILSDTHKMLTDEESPFMEPGANWIKSNLGVKKFLLTKHEDLHDIGKINAISEVMAAMRFKEMLIEFKDKSPEFSGAYDKFFRGFIGRNVRVLLKNTYSAYFKTLLGRGFTEDFWNLLSPEEEEPGLRMKPRIK